jgi:hypothetical protein
MRNPFRAAVYSAITACCFGLSFSLSSFATGELEGPNVAVTVIDEGPDKHADFSISGKVIAGYHLGTNLAQPYLWPVNGPNGEHLTRGWPMQKAQPGGTTDHVHHKSVWFCHGDVIPEGLSVKDKIRGVQGVDFWSEGKGRGRIVCTHTGQVKPQGDHARLDTRNEWRTAEGEKVLDEKRIIHLYDLGEARLFVFDIDLCASVCPITFGDTKEGSFGVRINDVIREVAGKGKLETADGKVGERACWGRQSAWCDYSGPSAGKTVGLAILDHPANRYPACWHCRGYGLMAANPFGRAKSGFPAEKGDTSLARLAKGEHLRLRYGLLIHPGDAKEGRVAEYFDRFVRLAE